MVGLAYGLFVVKIGKKTAFGHARAFFANDMGPLLSRIRSNMDERMAELDGSSEKAKLKREEPRPKARAVPEKKRAKDEAKKTKIGAAPTGESTPSALPTLSDKERSENEEQVRRLKDAEAFAETLRAQREAPGKKRTEVDEHLPSSRRGVDSLLTAKR
ncbi:MAG: hypothetical protein U1E65_15715 [Myxococcota bacterium]